MSNPRKISQNRGILAIMGIAVVVSSIILISIMVNNSNFNNDLVQGEYSGSATFITYPNIFFELDFNGRGLFDGDLTINGTIYSFTSKSYVVIGTSLQFSLVHSDPIFSLSVTGLVEEQTVSGEIIFYESAYTNHTGSISLFKS